MSYIIEDKGKLTKASVIIRNYKINRRETERY